MNLESPAITITIITIILGTITRLSNLGWAFILDLPSIIIFSLTHFIIMLTYIQQIEDISFPLIINLIICNVIYLGTLIFQSDEVAIDRITGIHFFWQEL